LILLILKVGHSVAVVTKAANLFLVLFATLDEAHWLSQIF